MLLLMIHWSITKTHSRFLQKLSNFILRILCFLFVKAFKCLYRELNILFYIRKHLYVSVLHISGNWYFRWKACFIAANLVSDLTDGLLLEIIPHVSYVRACIHVWVALSHVGIDSTKPRYMILQAFSFFWNLRSINRGCFQRWNLSCRNSCS